MDELLAEFGSNGAREREELPPCDVEHLEDLLMLLKARVTFSVRAGVVESLLEKDGAYIVKLLDMFDLCELDGDKTVLHNIFNVFYALLELCDRSLIEVLLSDDNFLSVVGVLGYNPGLLKEMDFRADLEASMNHKEVIPIPDQSVLERVHMNFRIHVIKDNVLVRSLPDGTVILLDHIVNENNYHILTNISETEGYWTEMKRLVQGVDKRSDGLGLLKEVLRLVRTTRPLDRFAPQRRDGPFGPPPAFGELVENLFGDGTLFEAFGGILGGADSSIKDITQVVDILNALLVYQGPDRLRAYLASEGKCVAPPTSDKDRLAWKQGSSLFTALLVVFERLESTRVQLFTLLREVFRIPLGQDDKFLNVLYPNYMQWLLQPLKYTSVEDAESSVLFDLHDSVMELLTFCTENHGYRIKYLFGRQPIAAYVEQMLRSKNKLFVIHAVKFLKACAARAEAFFSRFIIQNNLLAAAFSNFEVGKSNTGAVSSAILELVAFIEKTNMTALVEHVYTKFYETYKAECPIVFNAIRVRYVDHHIGAPSADMDVRNGSGDPDAQGKPPQFVEKSAIDAEEEMYWEKDDDDRPPPGGFTPGLGKNALSDEEIPCRTPPQSLKLVDYEDEDDESSTNISSSDKSEDAKPDDSDSHKANGAVEVRPEDEEEHELKLPERPSKSEDDSQSFFGGSVLVHKKKKKLKMVVKSTSVPQITLKSSAASEKTANSHDDGDAGYQVSHRENGAANGAAESSSSSSLSASLIAKRKLELEEAKSAESLVKKPKTCSPVTSS